MSERGVIDDPHDPRPRRKGRSRPATVYDGLFERYKRAYAAANGLKGLAVLMMVVGVFALLGGWGSCSSASNSFSGTMSMGAGLTLVGWGAGTILLGLTISALASILRVLIDRTVFAAPGLSDQERLNLVFKATGNIPPRINNP